MSHNVTETDTFPLGIPVPDSADRTYPDTVPEAITKLAHRTNHHQTILNNSGVGIAGDNELYSFNGLPGEAVGVVVPVEGRADVIRNIAVNLQKNITWLRERCFGTGIAASTMPWIPSLVAYNSTYWTDESFANTATAAASYVNQTAVSANYAAFSFPVLPPGLVMKTLTVLVSSPITHGGFPMGSMPRVSVVKTALSGSTSEIAAAVDSAATQGAYEGLHNISVAINLAVEADCMYTMQIRGESSSNAEANSFRVFRASLGVWYE